VAFALGATAAVVNAVVAFVEPAEVDRSKEQVSLVRRQHDRLQLICLSLGRCERMISFQATVGLANTPFKERFR
jgi:hypothetical protein